MFIAHILLFKVFEQWVRADIASNISPAKAFLFGSCHSTKSLSVSSHVDVAGTLVPISDKIKLLGVILDRQMTLDKHVNEICRSAHFHTRALRHVRNAISDDTAKTVTQALVSSWFDYANSILYGAPKYNISKLQRAQNVLARIVTRSHRRTSADALLHKLHWLHIEDGIVFKLALLTYKTLLLGSPSYLSTLLTIYRPPSTLRSSNSTLLCATRTKLLQVHVLFDVLLPLFGTVCRTTSSRLVLSNRFVRRW